MLQDAATIAAAFGVDPVEVLNGSWFDWAVRLAAVKHAIDNKLVFRAGW